MANPLTIYKLGKKGLGIAKKGLGMLGKGKNKLKPISNKLKPISNKLKPVSKKVDVGEAVIVSGIGVGSYAVGKKQGKKEFKKGK
tara:strand:+ start:217 stop:471 length:255 start_codon:yes stop_codon:yes gene_type:complete